MFRDVAGTIRYLSPASRREMATEQQIQRVITNLSQVLSCAHCGTRFRFGDVECPHCGTDLEEDLRQWAVALIDGLELDA